MMTSLLFRHNNDDVIMCSCKVIGHISAYKEIPCSFIPRPPRPAFVTGMRLGPCPATCTISWAGHGGMWDEDIDGFHSILHHRKVEGKKIMWCNQHGDAMPSSCHRERIVLLDSLTPLCTVIYIHTYKDQVHGHTLQYSYCGAICMMMVLLRMAWDNT